MKIFSLLLLLSLLQGFGVFAQPINFAEREGELVKKLRAIVTERSYSRRDSLNTMFLKDFNEVLQIEGSFNYPFDSLKNIGRLKSDDDLVRIFTWNIPQVGGTQKYFGFIQSMDEDKNVRLFCLTDSRELNDDVFNKQYGIDTWQGALYYQVVAVKGKTGKYYVLLGYDYNNLFTSKKIIEVLSFSRSGQPIFGAKVFNVDGKQRLSRILFEFAARVSMTLRYEEKQQTIVFDHLSPSSPQYTGNLQYYGPDFSYDGFKFDNGEWVYVRDLDMRNSARQKEKSNSMQPPAFMYSPNYKKTTK